MLKPGGYFGDDTIVLVGRDGKNTNAKRTVTTLEDCTLGVLTLEMMKDTIDVTLLEKPKESVISSRLDTSIKFTNLSCHELLGSGTFGQVWLVGLNGTKNLYALKVQKKKELISHHQVDSVLREKMIMSFIDHPFIITLINAYQDKRSLYMLMRLVQRGELFSVIHTHTHDGLSESSAKFYAAGVLEGLSYMHRRHIVYRDLKPENVMLDCDGYTVIVDLGFAKIVPDKTYTLCGTPLYLAPEVIQCRGHDKGADHWSFGVMIYEMIIGVTPFMDWDENLDQVTLFGRIIDGKISLSSRKMIKDAKDLLKRILVPSPVRRLGSFAGGDKDIRDHPWFADIDFERLSKKETKAPVIPKTRDPLDEGETWPVEYLEDNTLPLPTADEQKLFEGFAEYISA